nr:XRE family transcriptional regulator [Vibrio mediterranei]
MLWVTREETWDICTMDAIAKQICEELKRALKNSKMSYLDVAKALQVSEVSVKRMLNLHQPLSISRMNDIAALTQIPLSTIVLNAENAVSEVPTYTEQQDSAFCQSPELYTLMTGIIDEYLSADELMQRYDLDKQSMYLYLRDLENVGLITLSEGLEFKLSVPRHIAFGKHSQFANFFKNQVIDALKAEVQEIDPDDNNVYLISAKLTLTEEEFHQYNLELEELMINAHKLSQSRYGSAERYNEYTILDMGAKGTFQPKLKLPGPHSFIKR